MELSHGDRLNPLWIRFCGYLKERIESNRLQLEVATTEKEADKLRGRIAEDKLIFALNDDVPTTEPNLVL